MPTTAGTEAVGSPAALATEAGAFASSGLAALAVSLTSMRRGERRGHLQAEIVDPDQSRGIDPQVRRLHVPVPESLPMRRLESASSLEDHHRGAAGLDLRRRVQDLVQRGPADPLDSSVVVAAVGVDLPDRDQVRMADLGGGEGLANVAGPEHGIPLSIGGEDLEDRGLVERDRPGQERPAAGTVAQKPEQDIAAEDPRDPARQPMRTKSGHADVVRGRFLFRLRRESPFLRPT